MTHQSLHHLLNEKDQIFERKQKPNWKIEWHIKQIRIKLRKISRIKLDNRTSPN